MNDELRRPSRSFSLTEGGPFYRLLVRLRLINRRGHVHCWWIALALWLPFMIGAGLRELVSGTTDPAVFDLSLHVRLVIALPLFLFSERMLDPLCDNAINSLYEGELCPPDVLDPIVDRATWLRDAWWIEGLLLALAILGGQLVLWRVTGAAGMVYGGEAVDHYSFTRVWYALVALPVVQFLLYRWLWRWCIWSFVLMRIARAPLAVLATHPDRACGLGCLAWPVPAFGGFALAASAVLAAAWATQVLAHRATTAAHVPGLVGFVLAVLAIAVGPLLLFCGHLFRARRLALFQYSDFALTYVQQFQQKWIVRAPVHQDALGSPDIQSLHDLDAAYQVVEDTRWFVFGPRHIVGLLLAGIVPMLPLFSNMLTVEQGKHILSMVLGGLAV